MAGAAKQEALTDELDLLKHIRENDASVTTIHVHKAVNGAGNRGARLLTIAVEQLETVREQLLATYGPGTYVLQSKRDGGVNGRSATVELIAPLGWSPPTRAAQPSTWGGAQAQPSPIGSMFEQMQMMKMWADMMKPPKDPLTQLTETIAMKAAMQNQGLDPKEMLELGMRLSSGTSPKSDAEVMAEAVTGGLAALLGARAASAQKQLPPSSRPTDAPVGVVVRLLPMACALVEHGAPVEEALDYLQSVIGCSVAEYRARHTKELVDELGARPDLLERVNACGLGAAMMA